RRIETEIPQCSADPETPTIFTPFDALGSAGRVAFCGSPNSREAKRPSQDSRGCDDERRSGRQAYGDQPPAEHVSSGRVVVDADVERMRADPCADLVRGDDLAQARGNQRGSGDIADDTQHE